MTQAKEQQPLSPTSQQTAPRLSRAGEKLGKMAGQAMLRVQQATQGFREEADEMDALEPESQQAKSPKTQHAHAQKTPPAAERAEELVDQFLQRTTQWTVVNNLRARRGIARLREDAEDMWVEAQHLRSSWSHLDQPGQSPR